MATVRKLITKLTFETNLSQANKYGNKIDALKKKVVAFDKVLQKLNTTSGQLKPVKFPESKIPPIKPPKIPDPPKLTRWQRFRRRFKTIFLKLSAILDSSPIGKRIKEWGKKAKVAIDFLNTAVIVPLTKFKNRLKKTFTGILGNIKKNRFKLVAAAAAAVAAIKAAIGKAATEQDLDISIKFFTKSRSVKAINDDIAKLRKDLNFGQLFTDIDIKTAIVQSLQEGISPESIKKLLRPAIKIAGASGLEIADVLGRLTSFSVRGGEETLTPLGLIDQATIEAIKKAEREAGKLTNSRKLQIVLALALNKESRINATFEERLLSTTVKVKQVSGEIEESFSKIGEAVRENTNKALDETRTILRDIRDISTGKLGLIDFLTGRSGAISELVKAREARTEGASVNQGVSIDSVIFNMTGGNAIENAKEVIRILNSERLQVQAAIGSQSTVVIGAEGVR